MKTNKTMRKLLMLMALIGLSSCAQLKESWTEAQKDQEVIFCGNRSLRAKFPILVR
jgi:hypothetical protein